MAKITEILKHNEKSLKSSAKHLVDGKGHGMEGHDHTTAIGNIDGVKKIINTKPDGTIEHKGIKDDYDGSGGYASDEDWAAFLKTDKGKEYIKKTQGYTETVPGSQNLQDIPTTTPGTPGTDPIPEKSVTEGDYLTAGETREAGKILKLRNKSNKKLKKQATKSLNKMVKQGINIEDEIAAGNQSVISLLEQSGGYNKDGKYRKGFLGLGGLDDDFVSTSDKVDVKNASSDPRVTNPYVRRPGSAQGVNRNNLDGKIVTQEAVPGTEGTPGTTSPTTPAGPDDTVYKKNPNTNKYEPVADPNTTEEEIVATTNLSSQMDTNVTGSGKPSKYKNPVARFKVKGYKMGGFGSKASK